MQAHRILGFLRNMNATFPRCDQSCHVNHQIVTKAAIYKNGKPISYATKMMHC